MHRSQRQIAAMSKERGSMLLEALVAIVIFSIGVLALIGLQTTAVRSSADAKYVTDASLAANRVIGLMWADKNNLSSYVTTNLAGTSSNWVGDALPNGTGTIAVNGTLVTVTVNWRIGANGTTRNYTTTTNITPAG